MKNNFYNRRRLNEGNQPIYDITGSFTDSNGYGDTLLFNFHGNEEEVRRLIKRYLPRYQFVKDNEDFESKLERIAYDTQDIGFDDFIIYCVKKDGKIVLELDEDLDYYIPDITMRYGLGYSNLKEFLVEVDETIVCSFPNIYLTEPTLEEMKEEVFKNSDLSDEEIDEVDPDDIEEEFYSDFITYRRH